MKYPPNINDRLRYVRQLYSITQKQMGVDLGLNPSKIRDLESGKVKISTLHALALKDVYKINPDWLLYGKGPLRIESDILEKTIGKGIEYIRLFLKMNKGFFAKKAGVDIYILDSIEKGEQIKDYNDLYILINHYNINLRWLFFREGEPLNDNKTSDLKNNKTQFLDPDPEINDLLKKTRDVLVSDTSYAESLKANVNSFHESVKAREEIKTMRSEINYLKNHIITDRRKEDRRGPSSKGRIIESINKDRREGKDRRKSGLGEEDCR